ncbi:hypothetical protein imdm_232 [gamma proteobacterium IMCC2047]|nr:hypothetical protein imdm_232 [gamma proteobacterium IMCC2047]
MGTSLTLNNFKLLLQTPGSVITGLASQLLLLPVLAYAMLPLFKLPPEIFIGFMILALSPGGTTSNMFTYLAKGNLALSVSLTAIASLITPLSIPLIASWVISVKLGNTSHIELPFLQTLAKLVLVTLLPVMLGMLLRYFKSAFCLRHEYLLTRIPLLMLLLVITGIIQQNWQQLPEFIALTGIPALLLASAALATGYLFARSLTRNKTDSRTIAIETAIQNGGTAILITGTILNNESMTIAPVMYGILMLVPIFIYLAWLQRSK